MTTFSSFTQDQLDLPLSDVLGGQSLALEDFGTCNEEYENAHDADFDTVIMGKQMNDDTIKLYRFQDMQHFMNAYARAHLWNRYKYKEQGSDPTVRTILMGYYEKTKMLFPASNVPVPPNDGNIIDYLKSYDFEWLVGYGW